MASRLDQIFERAQKQGLLGQATSPRQQWAHAAALTGQLADPGESRCLDLGTGSGLPGLVMAACWSATTWLFTDRRQRSEIFVLWAVGLLDMAARATFERGDVAALGRAPALAGTFDVVVARSFGSPAVTAECATGFLAVGGRLIVSEPRGAAKARWPGPPLARLGLTVQATGGEPRFAQLLKVAPQEARYPRGSAAIRREPLY